MLAVESTKLVIALGVYFLASNEKKIHQKLKFLLRFKGAIFLVPPGPLRGKPLPISLNLTSRPRTHTRTLSLFLTGVLYIVNNFLTLKNLVIFEPATYKVGKLEPHPSAPLTHPHPPTP